MNESKATRFQRDRRRRQMIATSTGLVTLTMLAFTPIGTWARNLASRWAAGAAPETIAPAVALILFATVAVALWQCLSLAIAIASGAGARTSAPASLLLAIPGAVVFGAIVLGSALLSPDWWWALAGIIAAVLLVASLEAGAMFVAGSSGATPLARPALVELLGGLARRVRVDIESIEALPPGSTLTTSAIVTGLGSRRRIYLAPALLRDWPDADVSVVVAHELAHHAHRDLLTTLGLDVVVLAAGFRAAEAARAAIGLAPAPIDLGQLPLVALVVAVVWIAAAPLRHAVSRWQERRADAFAIRLTGRADAFQSAVRRLAAEHLAEERPSRLTQWLYYRHPSVAERLAAADAFQRRE
jgi:STE24 endopeptidase